MRERGAKQKRAAGYGHAHPTAFAFFNDCSIPRAPISLNSLVDELKICVSKCAWTELRIRKPVQAESEQRRHDEGDAQCPVQHSAIGVVRKVAQESYHRASFVRTQFQHTTVPIAMRSG